MSSAPKIPIRQLWKVGKSHSQLEGAGFEVNRPFPSRSIPDEVADPFLMLDEFGPKDLDAGAPGAPWHPHRGFDTVTYLKEGEGAHQDSMGNSGVIKAGEVQWMRAGSGIIHDEGRDHPGGPMHGFQVWVNLPKALKMSPPSYQQLSAETFQWVDYVSSYNKGVSVKVIAGELPCAKSPFELSVPVMYLDVSIEKGGRAQILIPGSMETSIMYVYGGEGKVFDGCEDKVGTVLRRQDYAVFKDPAEEELDGNTLLQVEASSTTVVVDDDSCDADDDGNSNKKTAAAAAKPPTEGLHFMLMAGKKIREPIARYGPFVMNTEEELKQAFRDYQEGKLAQTKGSATHF